MENSENYLEYGKNTSAEFTPENSKKNTPEHWKITSKKQDPEGEITFPTMQSWRQFDSEFGWID